MILLAGGTGFIGSALAKYLVHRGHAVRTASRTVAAHALSQPTQLEHFCRDMSRVSPDDPVFDGVTGVVDLMATTSPARSMIDVSRDLAANLVPSINLLECIRARRIPKHVFISSGGTVYGVPRRLPVSEDEPTNPISSYGVMKLALEKYAAIYCSSIDCRWYALRMSNAYGLDQLSGTEIGVIANFVRRHARGEGVEIWGDGSIIRDYVFISDVVEGICKMLESDRVDSGPYNLGSGTGHSLLQVIDSITRISGVRIAVNFLAARTVDVPAVVLDIARITNAIGWRPRVSFEEGVGLMWEGAKSSLRAKVRF
jgi:UDP-glucose 4-epimerase